LGLVLWLALLLWRLVERTLRVHVETTGSALTGWDKKETRKPTAFMMRTKFAAVLVLKVGFHRQLAQPLSAVQQAYLNALGVPATAWTVSPPGSGHPEGTEQRTTHWDSKRWREAWRGRACDAERHRSIGCVHGLAAPRLATVHIQVRQRQEQIGRRTSLGLVCLRLVQG
jgi:hypothetical protein